MGLIIDDLLTKITVQTKTEALSSLKKTASQYDYLHDLEKYLSVLEKKITDKIPQEATYKLSGELQSLEEEHIRYNNTIDSGNMLGTIQTEQKSANISNVGPSAQDPETGFEYPLTIEHGAKPHKIEGNPFLYWDDASHPVKSVNHPGNKPYPFVKPSVRILDNNAEDIVSKIISGVID